MNRIFIFLNDPWNPAKRLVRDVTDLDSDQLQHYLILYQDEFAEIGDRPHREQCTPGQLLAAWVERIGPDRAGITFVRRRFNWINTGGAIGLLGSPMIVLPWVFDLDGVHRALIGLSYLLLGMCLGAGVGWFAASIVDAWENWRSWKKYKRGAH